MVSSVAEGKRQKDGQLVGLIDCAVYRLCRGLTYTCAYIV
jgi:hypothetical protein